MDVKLVVINGKKIACDSRMVADYFKKKHSSIVLVIKKVIQENIDAGVNNSDGFYKEEIGCRKAPDRRSG